MEMQGRAREGLAFLAATEPAWVEGTGFSVHLQTVLETIVAKAAQLSGTEAGAIYVPRDDQVAALEEGMAGERRQCGRAGVPTEMMELVALVGHRHRVDDLTEGRRARLHVDHRERVGTPSLFAPTLPLIPMSKAVTSFILFCLGVRTAWQTDGKDRTLARLARHHHVSAHHARELAGNNRPRPVPIAAAHAIQLSYTGIISVPRTARANCKTAIAAKTI